MSAPRLTKPLRDAMRSALTAALAGDGFDDGDFAGEKVEHFERALEWIDHKDRAVRRKAKPQKPN